MKRVGKKMGCCFATTFWICIVLAQPNISRIEYCIDTDPGLGNGTLVNFSGTNDVSTSFTINTLPLNPGCHLIIVRSKDVNGAWSHDNRWLFLKPYPLNNNGVVPNISKIEYYLDSDPGYGNGSPVNFAGTTDISTAINLNLIPLSSGVHIVCIRSQDVNGSWSHDNKWLILKPYNGGAAATLPNIVKVEYFVDVDPGFGNGNSIAITPGTDLNNLIFNLDYSNFSPGVHIISVRSQDANGAWSLDNKWLFLKGYNGNQPTAVRSIKAMEYYMDNDPGVGHGIQVAVKQSNQLAAINIYSNITGLNSGKHKLFIRSRDDQNAWSYNYVDSFNLLNPIAGPAIIINSISLKRICAKDSLTIGFDATGNYTAGNQFSVQMSDGSGTFGPNPVVIGMVQSTTDTIIKCLIPNSTPIGNGYRLRVVSNNPQLTGLTSNDSININYIPPAPTISGNNLFNAPALLSYSVPNVATSSFNWIVNGGAQVSGGSGNVAGIQWSTPVTAFYNGSLKVLETTQAGCEGDTGILNASIYKLRLNNTPSLFSLCPTETLPVSFAADGVYYSGNILTVQLSDSSGSFANPVAIGSTSLVGSFINQTGSINATIPPNNLPGLGYRVRIVSNNPTFTGSPNNTDISLSNCYCISNLSASALPSIDSVGITYTSLSNVSPAPTSPFYTNYPPSAGTTATVYQGDQFELSLKVNNNGIPYNLAVWVDYNNNHLFESSENVILVSRSSAVGSNWAQIPLVVNNSNARLRIRVSTDAITPADACKLLTNGETEDYTISFNPVLNCRWVGRVSTDWQNPLNWSCGIVPDITKSVMIPAGTPFSPMVISTDVNIDRLWIQPGATVTISAGRHLNVKGTSFLSTW